VTAQKKANEEDVKKNISDIIFKALTQPEPITSEQDKKIRKDIIMELEKLDETGSDKMEKIYEDSRLQEACEQGYDAGLNTANTINSRFSLFDTPDRTKAWERGHRLGVRRKNKKTRTKG